MNDEWPEGRIEFTTVNAGNLRRLHFDVVQAIQAVDRETCTAVVIPGASTGEAARILRMIVDGEVNNAAAERERIVAWMRDHEGREKYHDTYWDQWVTVDLSKNDYADKIERGAHLEDQ